MGYDFKVKNAVRVKVSKRYPWPWKNDPDRTLEIFGADKPEITDVLTKSEDGTYMKHTGVCCFGIAIPDEDVEPWPENPVSLRLL